MLKDTETATLQRMNPLLPGGGDLKKIAVNEG